MILSAFHLVVAPPRCTLRVSAVNWAARKESPPAKELRLPLRAPEVRKHREEDPKRKKQGEVPEEKTREEEGNIKPTVLR